MSLAVKLLSSKFKYLSEPLTVILTWFSLLASSLFLIIELSTYSQTGFTKSTITSSSASPPGLSTPIVNVNAALPDLFPDLSSTQPSANVIVSGPL